MKKEEKKLIEEARDEKDWYYCNNGHTPIQWKSKFTNTKCPICGYIGTFGRYYNFE